MKSMSFSGLLKLLCLCGVFAFAGKASAQDSEARNRLYIEDFTISSYNQAKVAVMLDNVDEIAGFDFKLTLPEGLSLDETTPVELTERSAPSQQAYYYKESGKVAVVSLQPNRNFSGNEGPVLFLNINVAPGTLLRNSKAEIVMEKITLTNGTGSQGWKQAEEVTEVTLLSGEFAITAQEAAYVVKPGVPVTVAVGLDNSAEVRSMSADIVLPAGFSVNEDSFKSTARCTQGIQPLVYPQADGVTTRVLLVDQSGKDVIGLMEPGATDNSIFTFSVTVPADFAAANAEIIVKNVQLTALGNQLFDGGQAKITLKNAKVPYDAAAAEVARLRKALEDALATIATEAPDVKDNFKGEDIATQINALETAVNAAYNGENPLVDYAAILEPVKGIDEAIAKLVADAKAAQEAEVARKAANEAAYKADLAAVAALQEKLDAAVAEITEKYPDFDIAAAKPAVQAAIDAAKKAADDAYAAVATAGNYESVVDSAKIEEQIAALVADAKATQDEAARKAANEAAYKADLAAIAALQEKLDAAVADVTDRYPAFDVATAKKAVQDAIDAAKKAADDAYAAVATAGNYESVVDSAKIEEQVAALVADAKAAQEEAARKAANEAAYKADMETIAGLQAKYDAALAEISEKYPDFDATLYKKAIQDALKDARKDADDAYAAVAEEGEYSNTVDTDTIEELIDSLLKAADKSGIDSIMVEVENGEAAVYNLQGMKIARPVSGQMNIVVTKSGEVRKIFVR